MGDHAKVHTKEYILDYADRLITEGRAPSYAVVRFNIRGMSNLNDQLGMELGTQLMCAYIHGLQELIGEDGIVARNGGDVFSALFPI